MKIGNVELRWLGHAGFCIVFEDKRIYVDPYNISFQGEANIILITHSHYDHCSVEDISKIAKDGTVVVLPADAQSKVTRIKKKIEMQVVEPGDSLDLDWIKVEMVPAYNLGKEFHPKSEGWIGYVVKMGNVVVYHAGDTDSIPEMEKLTGYGKKGNEFIALLPVGGKYTMNAEEAVAAATVIKPTLAVPMHYGSVIGSQGDAEKFVKLCEDAGVRAVVMEKV
jgi:L-ascorbate metabolism protein UlaG (beta-lactamase superfamily)